jgi:CDP-glucose 4,6-dehydratase
VTGHTGFKGSWLCLWLQSMGARVAGFALPPADESLFRLAAVGASMESVIGDIRAPAGLRSLAEDFQPEIVFHLAAQALVRKSYLAPAETYEVNVLGTVHLLEAVRATPSCRVVVNVTSDKCYENLEWDRGYREDDILGGYDPYSNSKACAELVTSAYRRSFFEASDARLVQLASARAGNVIGGGDFAQDRLIPDIMAAFRRHEQVRIRLPDAVRPWQHVLEPLSGYLLLAERMATGPGIYAEAWNFGPAMSNVRPVSWIVQQLAERYGIPDAWAIDRAPRPHEAKLLSLDSTKATQRLGWKPRWTLETALAAVCDWHRAHERGEPLREVVLGQIASYEASPALENSVFREEPRRSSAGGI